MSRERINVIYSLKEKLRPFLGKYWLYSGDANVHQFQSFDLEEDKFTIQTDRRRFVKDYTELALFLQCFSLVEPPEPTSEQAVQVSVNAAERMSKILDESGTLDKLTAGLMNAFNKLETDPAFTDQARGMNEIGRTVIDLYKVKVQAMKLVVDVANQKPVDH
jgi:hypothetical protein